ncbi:MAG: ABC transporter permease [Lautropia sp.]
MSAAGPLPRRSAPQSAERSSTPAGIGALFRNQLLCGLTGFAALVAIWHGFTTSGLVSAIFLPSPRATLDAGVDGLASGDLLANLLTTVAHMVQGWLLASIVAIAIGSLIGISTTARAYLQPTLEFLRPLPSSATIPVAIALVGFTPTMILGVITFGSMWPTLLATVLGFSSIEPRLREVAATLQMSRLAFIWKIGLPSALPDIVAGMKLSVTVALILSVVTEMIAGQGGLGTTILMSARSFRTPELYSGIFLLGIVGLVSNYGLLLVERRTRKWR